ncbi:hypothetical protein LIER_26938 [Lithospermum erythrorhizon]|uniref:Uncharacterized protein n=1 Tax=Lithospermum erythrorhizon TaxID=34254 RepID=A0AAV3RDK0_LITER
MAYFVEEGHLWNKCMEAFHAIHPLLSAEEGRRHLSSEPMDAFALSALYMIKDVEDSRSTRVEAVKRAEDRALKDETRLSQMDAEIAWRVEEFKDSEEGDLFMAKESAVAVACFVANLLGDFPQLAGFSVGSPIENVGAPGEQVMAPGEGVEATGKMEKSRGRGG